MEEALHWTNREADEEAAPVNIPRACVLLAMGRHTEAAEATGYGEHVWQQPFTAETRELIKTLAGRKILARIQEALQSVSEPAPLLLTADCFLDQDLPEAATPFLDRAYEVLRNHPFVNMEELVVRIDRRMSAAAGFAASVR